MLRPAGLAAARFPQCPAANPGVRFTPCRCPPQRADSPLRHRPLRFSSGGGGENRQVHPAARYARGRRGGHAPDGSMRRLGQKSRLPSPFRRAGRFTWAAGSALIVRSQMTQICSAGPRPECEKRIPAPPAGTSERLNPETGLLCGLYRPAPAKAGRGGISKKVARGHFRLSKKTGIDKGPQPLMFHPALRACASERRKFLGLSLFRSF